MLTIEKLREYGAKTDEGLGRCMNNEAFYIKLVGMALKDQGFEKLEESLDKNDLDTAFEAAHALKGVTGNLALTPLYDAICEITELLRSRTECDYSGLRALIKEQKEKLEELQN